MIEAGQRSKYYYIGLTGNRCHGMKAFRLPRMLMGVSLDRGGLCWRGVVCVELSTVETGSLSRRGGEVLVSRLCIMLCFFPLEDTSQSRGSLEGPLVLYVFKDRCLGETWPKFLLPCGADESVGERVCVKMLDVRFLLLVPFSSCTRICSSSSS